MRIIFLGTGRAAAPILETVLASPHEVSCVVTATPRRAGRGSKAAPTTVAHLAQSSGVDLFECEDINAPETLARLTETRADLILIVDFGQILTRAVLDVPKIDTINLHFSLLPELRGAAPVQWAIIRGFEKTGVTVFSVAEKMDSGNIYLSLETAIEPCERADMLFERLIEIGRGAVLRALEIIDEGLADTEPQDDSLATYAPKLTKQDGHLDFTAPAK